MLRYFIQEFHGYLIRIGPQANKYGDPYLWSIPLTDAGEFCGVSTNLLERSVVKTAIRAAHELGFTEPFWARIKEGKITMAHTPLHAKHGGKMGPQMDQGKVAEITSHYLDQIKAGKMKVEHIGEIDLGNGKYVRSFVIQE